MTTQVPSSVWQGKAQLGDGWATFSGVSGDNALHRHLALQVVMAREGNANVYIADHGPNSAPLIMIAPDIVHQLMPGAVLLIYLEPTSFIGQALTKHCVTGIQCGDDSLRNQLLAAAHHYQGPEWLRIIAKHFGVTALNPNTTVPMDRVEQLTAHLARRAELPKTLTQFAKEASLSPSRLRHRIVASVGMPFRSYLRWLRLQRALACAAKGASLTESAIAADFADAAHLSRTMRRHFGIAPRDVLAALR